MKFSNLFRFGVPALTLLLVALLSGPAAGVRAQEGAPATGDAASQPQAPAAALGTGFTYQGRLTDGGNPANGAYDFQFKLFDAAGGGTQIGGTVSKNDVAVSGGLFTTDLDFGASAFDGQARWLEVAVRPGASSGAYTTLAPRRSLLASPYATYSNNTRGIAVASDGRVGIGTNDPGTSNLRIQGANPIGTRLFIGNAGSGDASITLDASNGDFVGLDYAWIRQSDNLDFAIGYGDSERLTIKPDGKIGVGTANPTQLLQVQGNSAANTGLLVVGNADHGTVAEFRYPGSMSGGIRIAGDAAGQNNADFYLSDGTLLVRNNIAGKNIALLTTGGNVGIGTNSPDSRLTVNGDISLNGDISVSPLKLFVYRPGDRFTVDGKSMGHYSLGWFNDSWNGQGATAWLSGFAGVKFFSGGAPRQVITEDGRVGIGTTNPQAKLDVAGTTRTDVLQIDAGADLAERFQQTGNAPAEPGTVMVIDAANPGHLKVSDTAYDTKVAGIVSGAGDIKPGLTLSQEGVMDGDLTVAMAGRVYARCEATSSPIQPGDLLTTSDVPGHCMKAVDKERRDGTMLGKAMTGLTEGTGLVLVLVNLQ